MRTCQPISESELHPARAALLSSIPNPKPMRTSMRYRMTPMPQTSAALPSYCGTPWLLRAAGEALRWGLCTRQWHARRETAAESISCARPIGQVHPGDVCTMGPFCCCGRGMLCVSHNPTLLELCCRLAGPDKESQQEIRPSTRTH